MAKPKKFGAFAGVFTPSVLTILGVIMYMRLGWVVGNAGLITALAIIVISHIVSVSTGLSISSVATDKKIKTGGIYYILSRSLGFPMGGAIGTALFIGTALGISLYLVGFAESLLAVDAFRNFTGLQQDSLNSLRIIASIALIILVTLAFISTSLAIKSQYIIMAAILLSLISIVAGLLTGGEFLPASVSVTPLRNGASMQEIFGVFFPAVTGFTAGVAMSGDLKDPKKDIPRGTLASIAVGFIVYVGLAVLFAFFVDRDILVNDYNFLLKVSLYAPLVLAGIWGATLSSALGGILGGPRILQAIAKDKIMPDFFAKGYGASDEPRNALIFIFLIAEGGILIGSLNAIAEVVSMFYLASYGFINLAFFLESWASTDFRPSFKVKGITGLIGFAASFLVMAQLGVISMIAALVIMFGLFAWLNRKQLKSESGDVWQSVWLSVVRKALYSLNSKNLEERNWQPNIILFSGGEGKRPYLLEFGKDLVGRYGLLSNFDLHESKDKKYLFPKHLQAVPDENGSLKGVFTRRQTCSDIYTGIETIISTYGFSGIEPNTVIMGWMRQSKNPERFAEMIRRINELDINLLLIDYDKRYGFGKYKTVDIWWRGAGNNGNLALHLMKFLWASDNWKNATLRLLIGNPENENASKIRRHAEQVLNNMRIKAEIKIINNQIEQKPFYELIRTESLETDLIILGLPDIREGMEEKFVKDTSKLMQDIGTVILIKASSQFKSLNLGFSNIKLSEKQSKLKFVLEETEISEEIIFPDNPVLAEHIKVLKEKTDNFDIKYRDLLSEAFTPSYVFISDITEETEKILYEKLNYSGKTSYEEYSKKLNIILDKLLKTVQLYVKSYNNEIIPQQLELLKNAYLSVNSETDKILKEIPEYVFCKYDYEDLKIKENDDKELKRFKNKNLIKIKLSGKTLDYKIKFRNIVKQYIPYEIINAYYEAGKKTGTVHIQFIIELQKLIKNTRSLILKLQSLKKDGILTEEIINKEISTVKEEINFIKKIKDEAVKSVFLFVHGKNISLLNKISNQINEIHPNRHIRKNKNEKEIENLKESLSVIPGYWKRNEQLFLNAWTLELLFAEFENRMYRIIGKSVIAAEELINSLILSKTEILKTGLNSYLSEFKRNKNTKFNKIELPELTDKYEISHNLKELLVSGFEKFRYLIDRFPEKIELFTEDALNEITEHQFEDIDTLEVSVPSLLDYVIQSELNEPLTEMAETLPEEISHLEQSVHNILSLIEFTLFDADGNIADPDNNKPEDIISFITEQTEKLEKIKKDTENTAININRKVNERLSEVSNHLNIYLLIKNSGNGKSFAKEKLKRDKLQKLSEKKHQRKINLFKKTENIKSKSILFSRTEKRIPENEKTISKVKRTLDLVLKYSPDKEITEKIPYYYRQLFLRNENFNIDFFVNREQEINELAETYKRYETGYKGGILITGDAFSGKSFLSHYFAGKFFKDKEIYVIKPPAGGSVKIKDFENALSDAVQIRGFSFGKLSKLKHKSIFLFDDFELWWENSEQGFEITNKIKKLINEYGGDFLFIVNINKYALKILNEKSEFENYFLNITECMPFDVENTEKALMKRHNAGGISFILNNHHQNRIKPGETEKLYNDYFKLSGGNIGLIISSWISNIYDYKDGNIFIGYPDTEKVSLSYLTDKTNKILFQFLLHKHLTSEKLKTVMPDDTTAIDDTLAFLSRSGLISEISKGIYGINKFIYAHVKNHLKESGMI